MSGKSEQRDARNGSSHSRRKDSHEPPSLKRGSSSLTQGSHRSQLVDLVVEDREAEEEERAQVHRALGSTFVEEDHKRFQ